MTGQTSLQSEFKGAVAATISGLINAISPVLLFVSLMGPQMAMAGFWASLVCASIVPLLFLALRRRAAVMPTVRTASLIAFISLTVQLAASLGGSSSQVTPGSLLVALAAAGVMYLLASVLILMTGWLRWGNVFKMIPTPVTAGISNGIALILTALCIKTLSGNPLVAAAISLLMLLTYIVWPRLQLRLPALVAVPAVLAAALVGLAAQIVLVPAGFQRMPGPEAHFSAEWVSFFLWQKLAGQDFLRLLMIGLPGAVTLALVMILEAFTAAAAMESRFEMRVNPNRELVVLGGANIGSALLGGVPCCGSALRGIAAWLEGGQRIPADVMCVAMTTAAIVLLGPWLVALPAGLMAGLFLIQALMMLDPGFMQRLRSLTFAQRGQTPARRDLGFWITLVITLVAFFGNLVWACFVGVGLSCLAVLRRLSTNLTAQWAYLDEFRSRRVRSPGEVRNLARRPHRVGVLRLTGHLFFGNSTRLTQLADDLHRDAVAVVIDVRQVQDVDPSGIDALQGLIKNLVNRKLKVLVSATGSARAKPLHDALQTLAGFQHCIDLDRGLEVCEDLVLMNASIMAGPLIFHPLGTNGLLADLSDSQVSAVLTLGDLREVAVGDVLFHKDEPADGIWLLESGVVSILVGAGDDSVRLATFGPGQFVGEMGFIDGKTRSATAYADTPVRALLLDREGVAQLVAHHPDAALIITRNIARELSHRVRLSSALMADQTVDSSAVWADHALGNPSQF